MIAPVPDSFCDWQSMITSFAVSVTAGAGLAKWGKPDHPELLHNYNCSPVAVCRVVSSCARTRRLIIVRSARRSSEGQNVQHVSLNAKQMACVGSTPPAFTACQHVCLVHGRYETVLDLTDVLIACSTIIRLASCMFRGISIHRQSELSGTEIVRLRFIPVRK